MHVKYNLEILNIFGSIFLTTELWLTSIELLRVQYQIDLVIWYQTSFKTENFN